jgi:hypothetical protein
MAAGLFSLFAPLRWLPQATYARHQVFSRFIFRLA